MCLDTWCFRGDEHALNIALGIIKVACYSIGVMYYGSCRREIMP